MTFPGTRPIHGDTLHLTTDTTTTTITGAITCERILREGRGFVELTLPDADPEQRRTLEYAKSYQYDLYRGGALLYSSPPLRISGIRRISDGSLVVTGAP
ncbi:MULTISPECIES: hypothetical protein [unclassified Streptomyces]|uniref:hypothetical protein n=1 Tax=unclassified Streptomyces TaxID=2593676 RepID=UPI00381600CC